MRAIAVIPARGGSKRIPFKNIRPFRGRPVIEYAIDTARASGLFEAVFVSTDDERIAEVARKAGADVPHLRSEALSDDYATTVAVIQGELPKYAANGYAPERVCCIYPVTPLLRVGRLREADTLLDDDGVDSVLGVVEFEFPIQRALRREGDRMVWEHPRHAATRSQDPPARYHDGGAFYFLKTPPLLARDTLLSARTAGVLMSRIETQDVDTEEDWLLAEAKAALFDREA